MLQILQNFTLEWHLDVLPQNFTIQNGVFPVPSEKAISLGQNNFGKILHHTEQKGRSIIVLGSPIVNNQVSRENVAKLFVNASDFYSAARAINGEFLIVLWDNHVQKLTVINDRFTSYPAFWAYNQKQFSLSYAYMDLARHCRSWHGFKLCPERAYEFLILTRLLGSATHDNITQSLPPATILTVKQDEPPRFSSYWKPNYSKNNTVSKMELIDQFSCLFEKSVQTRTASHNERTGIFLSGGHDSRSVSIYAPTGATCYTLSFSNNLEVKCASEIAKFSDHHHVFCTLKDNFFEETLDISTELSGGLYSTDHALFIPTHMAPIPKADVFLHGHGLDYMYQGMYLHADYYHLFGRHTYLRRFLPFPEDMAQNFIYKAPFRLKYDIHNELIHESMGVHYKDSLFQTVNALLREAKTFSDDPHDHWEYMILHHISKHHTFSNVLSKRTCGELRTPSFDNKLYDFYLSLPYRYRLHGDILRGAMHKKNPKVANLYTANHALPAGWGPYQKTALLIGRKFLRHATFNRHFHVPSGKDRTWPGRESYFKGQYLSQTLDSLFDQDFKDLMPFLDWDKLNKDQDKILDKYLGGAFLAGLLSYYKFYKAVYEI